MGVTRTTKTRVAVWRWVLAKLSNAAVLTGSMAVAAALVGCAPALTVLGVGTATGVQHTLGGISYRTFTTPLPQVRKATLTALNRMGIKVSSDEKTQDGELIKANAVEREIEITLDAVTASTTRMRTIVRNGMFMDAATGTEVIMQTEKALATKLGRQS